jgi:divalent metal cation (Fe/Co/Zn/Cd) transporter
MLKRKDHEMKSGIFAIWVSFISNLVLTILKIIVGLLFHSQVLIADGFHNAGDVIATLAALISSKVAKKPADDNIRMDMVKRKSLPPELSRSYLYWQL